MGKGIRGKQFDNQTVTSRELSPNSIQDEHINSSKLSYSVLNLINSILSGDLTSDAKNAVLASKSVLVPGFLENISNASGQSIVLTGLTGQPVRTNYVSGDGVFIDNSPATRKVACFIRSSSTRQFLFTSSGYRVVWGRLSHKYVNPGSLGQFGDGGNWVIKVSVSFASPIDRVNNTGTLRYWNDGSNYYMSWNSGTSRLVSELITETTDLGGVILYGTDVNDYIVVQVAERSGTNGNRNEELTFSQGNFTLGFFNYNVSNVAVPAKLNSATIDVFYHKISSVLNISETDLYKAYNWTEEAVSSGVGIPPHSHLYNDISDLASTVFLSTLQSLSTPNGAGNIGVKDTDNYFNGTTVEAVLKELHENDLFTYKDKLNILTTNIIPNLEYTPVVPPLLPDPRTIVVLEVNGEEQPEARYQFSGDEIIWLYTEALGGFDIVSTDNVKAIYPITRKQASWLSP